MVELIRAIHRMATARHLAYQRSGVTETVRLLPCPLILRPDQVGYTHYISQTLLNCLKRLPDLYFEVPQVRDILRVTPAEEEWLRECWTPAHREANPVFAGLDAVVTTAPLWLDSISSWTQPERYRRPAHGADSHGVCATWSCRMLAQDPASTATGRRYPRVLLQELLEHLRRAAGGGADRVVDPKYVMEGPDERDALAATP